MSIARSLFLAWCVPVLAASAAARGGNDDTCAQALAIGPGSTVPQWTEDSYSLNHPGWNYTDFDWYRVTLQPGQTMRLTPQVLSTSGQPGTLITRVLTGACPGTWVGETWGPNRITVTNAAAVAVDYPIQVQAFVWNEGIHRVLFRLDVEIGFSAGCGSATEDGFEVGPGIAVPLAPGAYANLHASTANDDAYTLRLPAGTTIRARIDFATAQGDLDLSIEDGTTMLLSDGLTDQEMLDYTATPPDAYRDVVVRVASKSGLTEVCNDYALAIDVLSGVGTDYCVAGINGHGTGASILAAGSTSVSANQLAFVAQAFPGVNQGRLIAGTTQAQIPFGDGFRCVGGAVVRLGSSTASQGVATYPLDFTTSAGALLLPGSTWNFQVHYRDLTPPGGAGFNLTNGVTLTLAP